LAVGALLGATLAGGSAWAQAANSDVRVLIERMERLETDLRGLQRQVFRGQPLPPGAAAPPPPPPPPEAPPIAGGIANALSARLDEIESQVRQLTGRVEETDHGISLMKQRVEKLVADVDFRLAALERAMAVAAQAPATTAAPALAPPAATGVAAAPAPGKQPPGVLGTLRVPADTAAAAVAARPGKLPDGSAQSQYNFAFGLLRQNDYVAAEQAFGEFLSLHPGDALASNAQYWLGESYFARKEYDRAAQAFLAGYQKYPKGSKAPDSLLKLAMSLSNLEQKQEACAAFKQLDKDFPSAAPSVQRLSIAERARAGCR
jgi:tol-pal system protein YbgF